MRIATVLAMLLALPLVAAGCSDEGRSASGVLGATASDSRDPTEAFLDEYVTKAGRVVRRDQGGDTVSEGQAYALLLAVADRDRRTFARVWRWTRRNLQRDDGALAWHWRDGKVVDSQPATDADLDAARALRLAAGRFDEPAYARASRRLVRVIRRDMVDDGLLLAGPWARDERWFNPSYVSPRAARTLRLRAAGARRIPDVMKGLALPPDWARGTRPSPSPGTSSPPRYGFDAVRLPIRLAESCRRSDRRIAARMWGVLRTDAGRLPRRLDGEPTPEAFRHPVALVGAAGAAHAAGKRKDARRLVDLAAERDRESSTYYGAAWAALGREMLVRKRLGRC